MRSSLKLFKQTAKRSELRYSEKVAKRIPLKRKKAKRFKQKRRSEIYFAIAKKIAKRVSPNRKKQGEISKLSTTLVV